MVGTHEVLTPALLALLTLIAMGAFGYLMGRLNSFESNLEGLAETVGDLKQRMYGREHDRTDPGGFLGEVNDEFERIHRRLDGLIHRVERDRRERRRDRYEIKRRLQRMDGGDTEEIEALMNDMNGYDDRQRNVRRRYRRGRRDEYDEYSDEYDAAEDENAR